MNVEVHYLGVLLAGVASMLVGFLWYSPILFAKPWMKLSGLSDDSMKKMQSKMGPMYGLSFLASLVTAYVMTHVMVMSENFFHYPMMQTGITTAISMWLGFVAPVQMSDVLFGGKKWALFAINTSYQLVSLLAMGLVISLFQ
jgi:hypothetical protein